MTNENTGQHQMKFLPRHQVCNVMCAEFSPIKRVLAQMREVAADEDVKVCTHGRKDIIVDKSNNRFHQR